jgi:hypothetical protein
MLQRKTLLHPYSGLASSARTSNGIASALTGWGKAAVLVCYHSKVALVCYHGKVALARWHHKRRLLASRALLLLLHNRLCIQHGTIRMHAEIVKSITSHLSQLHAPLQASLKLKRMGKTATSFYRSFNQH